MGNPEDVVFDLFKRIETSNHAESRQALDELLADDCVWANSGFPTAEGKAACLGLWDQFNSGFGITGIRVETTHWAARDNAVVTERIDHLMGADGGVIASAALAGTLEVRDGKVSAWRDYFDPRPFLPGG
jgi:limonene-1,2-epoxide hydrolase